MTVHRPTLVGRVRSDPGLLLLTALVVALTTALTAAVAPLTTRTADDAMAATVRDAGSRATVVAIGERDYYDPRGQARDPLAAKEFAQDTDFAQHKLPAALRRALRPGVATLTSTSLQLLDGLGRYLRLAYVDAPDDPPEVTWTSGTAPAGSASGDRADVEVPGGSPPWPVQVGLSEEVATALGLAPGDVLDAEDEHHRPVRIVVAGLFTVADPGHEAWQTLPELLHPVHGVTEGVARISAVALVTADSLPDLRLAVPADALTHRIVFQPRPERVRYADIDGLSQGLARLQSTSGPFSWDSLLGHVLLDGRAQVQAAQGQASVLLVGLLAATLLLLVLAGQLLVRRRHGAIAIARERGATLVQIAAEMLVEAVGVTLVGAAIGLGAAWILVGDVGWRWPAPVLVAAVLAPAVLGALHAAGTTDVRASPANRSARRAAARVREVRRVLLELAVLAAAALSLAALHQRGVVVDGSTDRAAAGAAAWWSVAGALLLLRAVPPATRGLLLAAGRTRGGGGFFTAARLAETSRTAAGTALPLLVVTVAVAQLAVGLGLAATERRGQEAGALLAVGADARLTTTANPQLDQVANDVAARPGVQAAVSGLVDDDVRVSARGAATTVRLVVVDAAAYARLLAASGLPGSPDLRRLDDHSSGDRVAALLLGGDPRLREDLHLRYRDAEPLALDVVGTAPRVDAAVDPVVLVDSAALAGHGLDTAPDTVWAAGPGAGTALRAAAELLGSGTGAVTTFDETLASRRGAPLPRALVGLAVAAAALLLLIATLGVTLGAALTSPGRGESLGRLRALGLDRNGLRRVLDGELVFPVAAAAVTGLVLGTTAALLTAGSLTLELVTGQTGPPTLTIPWWTALSGVALVVVALAVGRLEAARLRGTPLAVLLRRGDRT